MSLSRKSLSFAVLMALAGSAAAANADHPAAQRALDLVKANGAAARVAAGDAFQVKYVRIDEAALQCSVFQSHIVVSS